MSPKFKTQANPPTSRAIADAEGGQSIARLATGAAARVPTRDGSDPVSVTAAEEIGWIAGLQAIAVLRTGEAVLAVRHDSEEISIEIGEKKDTGPLIGQPFSLCIIVSVEGYCRDPQRRRADLLEDLIDVLSPIAGSPV